MMITNMMRDVMDTGLVTIHGNAAGFAQAIVAGGHALIADEPTSVGGRIPDRTRTYSSWPHSGRARR